MSCEPKRLFRNKIQLLERIAQNSMSRTSSPNYNAKQVRIDLLYKFVGGILLHEFFGISLRHKK